jgi:hypothetical protein
MLAERPHRLDAPLADTPDYATYLLQARHARTWHDMGLLDRSSLQKGALDGYMAAYTKQLSSRKKRFQLADDGYSLDLQQRPPTRHLDLLADYLEVKYADALLRRRAVSELAERMEELQWHGEPLLLAEGGGAAGGRRRLSPPEVSELNARADELFEADPAGYIAWVQGLHADGVLGPAEALQCVAAAEARLQRERWQAGTGEEGPVTEQEREHLLALLQGGGAAQAQQQQQQQQQQQGEAAAAAAEPSAEVQQLWQEAAQQVAGGWRAAADAAPLRSLAGGAPSLQQLLQADVPADAARALWRQYVAAAGCEGSAPGFDELLLASKQAHVGILRSEDVQQLQARLAELQRQYTLRSRPEALLEGEGAGEGGEGEGGGAARLAALVGQADLGALLQRHLLRVEGAFGIERREGEAGGATAGILQTLQPLAAVISRMIKSAGPGSSPAAAAAEVARRAQQPGCSSSSSSSFSSSSSDSSDADEPGSGSGAWSELLQRVERGELPGDGGGGAGGGPAHLQQYGLAPGAVAPPYPGARRLLRWRQTVMLHAAAALAEHPLDRVAKLGVNAAELAAEVGLSQEGLQHMLRVCGGRWAGLGAVLLRCAHLALAVASCAAPGCHCLACMGCRFWPGLACCPAALLIRRPPSPAPSCLQIRPCQW